MVTDGVQENNVMSCVLRSKENTAQIIVSKSKKKFKTSHELRDDESTQERVTDNVPSSVTEFLETSTPSERKDTEYDDYDYDYE